VKRIIIINIRVAIRARKRRVNRVLARRRLIYIAMFLTLSITLRII
jgi:hypothetical protein